MQEQPGFRGEVSVQDLVPMSASGQQMVLALGLSPAQGDQSSGHMAEDIWFGTCSGRGQHCGRPLGWVPQNM